VVPSVPVGAASCATAIPARSVASATHDQSAITLRILYSSTRDPPGGGPSSISDVLVATPPRTRKKPEAWMRAWTATKASGLYHRLWKGSTTAGEAWPSVHRHSFATMEWHPFQARYNAAR